MNHRPVHLLFPLTRMFVPSLPSLPSLLLLQFLRPAHHTFLIYLSVIRVYARLQEGDSKVAPTARQATGIITHGCPCVYKSNCSRFV